LPPSPTDARPLLLATALVADGGIQQLARDAVAALADGGRPLEVWTLLDGAVPSGAVPADVEIRCAGGSRSRLVRWAIAAAAGPCRGRRVIVMHAHLAPLVFLMQGRGALATIVLNGVEVWKPLSLPARAVFERADRLIAISALSARRFRQANPRFSDARIEICHLGVAAAAAVGGTPDPAVALIVSRLSTEDPYKGHEALLRAWPAVSARVPGARLVIVGDGDDRSRLETLARALGISGVVTFAGRVSNAELLQWYERCAFFALPSTGEGFGLVYLEAMRAGKACIACPGAAEEIVEHDRTGLIVPDQDPARLADAVVRLYANPALRSELGERGRARWRDTFTSAAFAERFRRITDAHVARQA
jgi:phosphatidylinositol alpha-1,6-mannosyltransferase